MPASARPPRGGSKKPRISRDFCMFENCRFGAAKLGGSRTTGVVSADPSELQCGPRNKPEILSTAVSLSSWSGESASFLRFSLPCGAKT